MSQSSDDWSKRSVIRSAKMKALDAAIEVSEKRDAVIFLVQILVGIVSLVLLWRYPSVRVGISLFVNSVVLHVALRVGNYFWFVKPEADRIEREYPLPKREE